MSAITEDVIRSLARIRSDHPVASCYLDVDGGRHVRQTDYQRILDGMLRRARGNGSDGRAEADLARIEARAREGFDRSRVRGVAMFSSVGEDLWEVVELPVPVRSQLVVNATPAVAQLEAVLQHTTTVGVLAADKVHARVFVFRLDELIEHVEVVDDLGRDYDTVGEHDRGGVTEHREELAHQHLRHATRLLWSAFQEHAFDHLVLAAPDHLASELEAGLHPYLRERLHGRLAVEPSASESAIRDAVLVAVSEIERAREAALVEDLRSAIGSGGRAVAGLDTVLDALNDDRVERLLVSDGYESEGWHCPACDRLATVGRSCACGAEMDHVEDLLAWAIDRALTHSCRVDVCVDNADLDVLGRIGAFLRY